MGKDYIEYYEQITGRNPKREYEGPEQEGNYIKKCTILESVKEVEYSNHCMSTNYPVEEGTK